jgi:hypothetical protein
LLTKGASFFIDAQVKRTLAIGLLLLGASSCAREAVVVERIDLAPAPNPTMSASSAANVSSSGVQKFMLTRDRSTISFSMEAPIERQRATFTGASLSGSVKVDLDHLDDTKGSVDVSLIELSIERQAQLDLLDPEWGDWSTSTVQNIHARAWLEIGEDASAEALHINATARFELSHLNVVRVQKTKSALDADVDLDGDLFVHGVHHAEHIPAEIHAVLGRGPVTEIDLETLRPFDVRLADFAIAPRDSFGKLAAKTLEVLAPKVAPVAQVSIALSFTSLATKP